MNHTTSRLVRRCDSIGAFDRHMQIWMPSVFESIWKAHGIMDAISARPHVTRMFYTLRRKCEVLDGDDPSEVTLTDTSTSEEERSSTYTIASNSKSLQLVETTRNDCDKRSGVDAVF